MIVYTSSTTDPYTDGSLSVMLNQNQSDLDTEIGNTNYDIGHVFGAMGGGGLASARRPQVWPPMAQPVNSIIRWCRYWSRMLALLRPGGQITTCPSGHCPFKQPKPPGNSTPASW